MVVAVPQRTFRPWVTIRTTSFGAYVISVSTWLVSFVMQVAPSVVAVKRSLSNTMIIPPHAVV